MVLFFLTVDAVFDKKLLSMRGCACHPRVLELPLLDIGLVIQLLVHGFGPLPLRQDCLYSFCQATEAH